MTSARLAKNAESPPNVLFRHAERPKPASLEGGLSSMRLWEALAREAALQRRADAL